MQPLHRNLDGLTGLRAIAAGWVIAFHYRIGPFRPIGANHVLPILGYGYLGVDLFFILSGFVIWHAHSRDFAQPTVYRFVRFLGLRAARLYPVHLFTLALLALLLWLAPRFGDPALNPANYTGRQLLLQLSLIQSWGFSDQLSWNYPSWSVSAEWFCYLIVPIAALAVSRSGLRGTVLAIVILMAGVSMTYLTVFDQTLNQAIGWLALLRALPEFLLGCLLRRLRGQIELETWPWTLIVAVMALVWTMAFWSVLPAGLLAIPLFCALILAASSAGSLIARIASWKPFVAVGAASYSLYLMQAPVQKGAGVLKAYLSPAHPARSAAIVVIYMGLLAGGTVLVHLGVENPSRRWLRTKIDFWLPRRDTAYGKSQGAVVKKA